MKQGAVRIVHTRLAGNGEDFEGPAKIEHFHIGENQDADGSH
jgi:hypothetical protein